MLYSAALAIILLGTWVVWSGFFDAFFLISDAIAVALAIYIAYRMNTLGRTNAPLPLYLNIKSVPYYFWLIKEIIISSLKAAHLMWQVKPDVSPTVACIPSSQNTDTGRALFANSITLTPGTVSMMVEEDKILVHALCKSGVDDLLSGEMDERVSSVTNSKRRGK